LFVHGFMISYLIEEYLFARCQFHQHSTCSFYAHRSQKHQKRLTTWLYFFALSGSVHAKAARRTLIKSTPGRQRCLEIFLHKTLSEKKKKFQKLFCKIKRVFVAIGYYTFYGFFPKTFFSKIQNVKKGIFQYFSRHVSTRTRPSYMSK